MLQKILKAFSPGTDKEILILLKSGSQNLTEMGNLLLKILSAEDKRERNSHYEPLEERGHNSQKITHDFLAQLSVNFLTLIDKEDLHQMASIINAISRRTVAIYKRVDLYAIKEISDDEIKITELIVKCTIEINSAILLLENIQNPAAIKKHCVNINSFENEAGKIIGHALKTLLERSPDQIEQIKHVELLDILESTVNKCEEMANCLEGVLTKMN